MLKHKSLIAAMFVWLSLIASSVNAEILVYEPFVGVPGEPFWGVDTESVNLGPWSEPGIRIDTDNAEFVEFPAYTDPNGEILPTKGVGAVVRGDLYDTSAALDSPVTFVDGESVWIGLRAGMRDKGGSGLDRQHSRIQFGFDASLLDVRWDAGTYDNQQIQLTLQGATGDTTTSPENIPYPPVDDPVNEFILIRIDFSLGVETIRLWRNPSLLSQPTDEDALSTGTQELGDTLSTITARSQAYHTELILDEIRIGETFFEVIGRSGPPTNARYPQPADGALHEDTWVTLSWKPGKFAVSHNVYLGDNSSDVEQATPDSNVFRGNQVADFYVAGFPGFAYPDGLVPGATYYWRIDEVNDADPNSPWKGEIWSFSIPPKTAYNPNPADGNGFADMTVTLGWTPGFGAKLHTVFLGDDFDEVNNATVGVPTGEAYYTPASLEQEKVYYWRVDEFDGLDTFKGDVWTFTTPGAVGNPQPANSATDVAMAAILNWTPADNAASHEIYFGLDKDTVRNADTGSPEYKGPKVLGAESYDPGLLNLGTTYYWRVDEVYNGTAVKGPVWSFTVGDFLMVDDFESYTDNDADGEAVWQHWIDGFGVSDNGAQAGNLLPPYCEQRIVHGGDQSMPLLYFNEAGVTNSEAALTLTAPRDWTVAGVGQLSLWIRGDAANAAEPLYVAISNTAGAPAVAADDDPSAATNTSWRQWCIELQVFADQGIDLANVDRLAIGLGSEGGAAAGGIGKIYIDDIRLYRAVSQP